MAGSSSSADEAVTVKAQLGVLSTTSYVVGAIIGSGIFVSPKGIIQNVQLDPGVSLLVWAACGVIAILGSLVAVEFGLRVRKSGGRYAYIREAWGDPPAFVYIWAECCLIQPCGLAIVSLTVAQYITLPLLHDQHCSDQRLQWIESLVATVVLLILAYVNGVGVKHGAAVQIITTICKVLGLLIIIVTGLVYLSTASETSFRRSFNEYDTFRIGDLVLAFYSGMWAFGGWDCPNWGGQEIKNIRFTLPFSIIFGISLVTVVYLLANVAYLSVLTPEDIVSSAAVGVLFADRTLGVMSWSVPATVVISVLGAVNANLFIFSRVIYAPSHEGHFPALLGMIHHKRATPVPALVVATGITLVYMWSLDIYGLIDFFSFIFWLGQAVVAAGLVYLRVRDKMRARGVTEQQSPTAATSSIQYPLLLHIIFTVVAFVLGLVPFVTDYSNALKGAGLLALGVPIYAMFLWRRSVTTLRIPERLQTVTNCDQSNPVTVASSYSC